MAANLTIRDGRRIYLSTVSLMGVYVLVAEELMESHPRFARWLAVVAERDAVFMSIDLRAVSDEEAEAFEQAAVVAYRKLVSKVGVDGGENHFARSGLARLAMTLGADVPLPDGMKALPDEFDGPCLVQGYDFDELWK